MLILDTDIASAFAKSGHFDAMVKLFGSIGITPGVYEELSVPLEYGYEYPEEIFEKAKLVTISDEEQREYLRLKRGTCQDWKRREGKYHRLFEKRVFIFIF